VCYFFCELRSQKINTRTGRELKESIYETKYVTDHSPGGLGEVGRNMMAYEYGGQILVVDCGLMFPENDMLGVDYIIPDLTYLRQHRLQVVGIVITTVTKIISAPSNTCSKTYKPPSMPPPSPVACWKSNYLVRGCWDELTCKPSRPVGGPGRAFPDRVLPYVPFDPGCGRVGIQTPPG